MQPSAITMGMTVQATDGAAGKVDDVLVQQEGGQLHALVVQGRGFFANEVVVPASALTNVADGRVYVNLTRKEVNALPVYQPGQYGRAQGLISQAAHGFDRHDRDPK